MKIKSVIAIVCMFLCMQLWAQEFKVGDAKYLVRPDGKVELKEYKKAQGEVTLPSAVTDPKSSKQYTLASVGKEAFKKSGVTKVVLPASLEANGLGEGAFKDCKSLEYVEFPASLKEIPKEAFRGCKSLVNVNDDNVEIIGEYAYRECNLKQWSISPTVNEIGYGAFMLNPGLKIIEFQPSDSPLRMGADVFLWTPVEALVIGRDVYVKQYDDITFSPFKKKESVTHVIIGPNVTRLSPDFFEGCPSLAAVQFSNLDAGGSFLKALDIVGPKVRIVMDEETYTVPDFKKKAKFRMTAEKYVNAVKDIDGCKWLAGTWNDFTFSDIQENMNDCYDMLYNMADIVIDEWEVPFPASHCSEVVAGIANSLLGNMTLENGGNPSLNGWAKADMLHVVHSDTTRTHAYEIVLSLAEKMLKTDPDNNVYACALQLAGLCGQGRWQEAAKYYPSAHRLITENGKYAVPYELTYMRDVINEHGYKAKDPVYAKTTSARGAKSKSKASGGQNGYKKSELMEYFFEKGYERYQRHRAERRYKKWLKRTGQIQ